MAVKHIYLVRHGETADNRRSIHQSIHVSLNERGRAQAAAAGKALAAFPIDAIVTSDADRTEQTAAAVSAATGSPTRSDQTLRELHRGVLIEGTHHLGWTSITGSLGLFFHAGSRSWHHGDGENLMEFRDRVQRVLALLAETPGEHVVAVTHRGIINGVRYGIKHGFTGSIRCFIFGALFGKTKNGSITHLTYDPDRTEPWRIELANDTRHLAGV